MADMSIIAQANASYGKAGSAKLQGMKRAMAAASQEKNLDNMKKVAQNFEAMFLAQMMQPMVAEIGKDDPFAGPGQDIWRSMQAEEYGKAMAKSGGIGIADAVLSEMIKMQEAH